MTPSHKLFLLWDNMLLYLSTLWTPNEPLWRRQWHPTPVLLPGKSHGWRSLVGCRPWGHKESDMTEWLHSHFSLSCIGEGNGNPLQCSCLEDPRDGGASWAAVYGVAQSWTRLKRLSSGSSSIDILNCRWYQFKWKLRIGSFECFFWLCHMAYPDQGLNPGPLQWKHGILTTAPPRKSLKPLKEGGPQETQRSEWSLMGWRQRGSWSWLGAPQWPVERDLTQSQEPER